MSLLEKDKLMMQHRTTEYQRKADQEGEKRRNMENEGLFIHPSSVLRSLLSRFCWLPLLVLSSLFFIPRLLPPLLFSSIPFN